MTRLSLRLAITLGLLGTFTASSAFLGDCDPEGDPTCPLGQVFDDDSGQCVSGCFDNTDCPSGQVCQEVWCFTTPCYWQCGAPPCQLNEDCGEHQWCDDGECRDEGWCDQAQDCAPQGLPHVMCIGDWSCEQNQCVYHCGALPVDECTAVPAGQWGLCKMLMGVVWDGTGCSWASGCGCNAQTDPFCDYIYPDLATCQAATSHCGAAPLE